MGAGRRTETVNCDGHSLAAGGSIHRGSNEIYPQRKLAERNRLSSVVFVCSNDTYNECVTNKLFGLPQSHHSYVELIPVGMPLFLFNYNDRKMHGIFEAVSQGALNINPYAWTKDGPRDGGRTQFPAQVRVLLRADFSNIVSLTENVYKEALIDSYYEPHKFFLEVDSEQTDRLIRLFERAARKSYGPVAEPKISTDGWQTVNPRKARKKTTGSGKTDDDLNLKKPLAMAISEYQKSAQYFPSSSKEVMSEDVVPSHQQSVWSGRSSYGDDNCLDEIKDLQTTYKSPEVDSEAEMGPVASNEKPEQEPGEEPGKQMTPVNGYGPQPSGTSELQPSTSEEQVLVQKPATMFISEHEKGAQYMPSSSKEPMPQDVARSHQQSVWRGRSSNGDDDCSDELKDLQTNYKSPEVDSGAEMRPMASNGKPEQEPAKQMMPVNAYGPQPSGTSELQPSTSEAVQLKKPATMVISEHEKGEQYFPSSSKAAMPEDVEPGSHQQSVWNGSVSSNGEDYFSDESEDLQTTYKAPEVKSEAEMGRTPSNEKPEQEPAVQMKSVNGYRAQQSGTSELQPSTSEEVPTAGTDLTDAQIEVKRSALKRLICIKEKQQFRERLTALENSQAAMATEMQALKLEVVDLRRQSGKSRTKEKFERV